MIVIPDVEHRGIDVLGALREQPLKVSEERRVVECPFGAILYAAFSELFFWARSCTGYFYFVVPLSGAQSVRDGKPVAVDFKIGRFAISCCLSVNANTMGWTLSHTMQGKEGF